MKHRTRRRAALVVGVILLISPAVRGGTAGPGPFDPYPSELGQIIVAEQNAGRVLTLEPDGTAEVIIEGLVNPRGLAISEDGNTLVVAEAGAAPSQGVIHLISSGDQGPVASVLLDNLDFPEGAAFAADRSLIFTTTGGINVFDTEGSVATHSLTTAVGVTRATPTAMAVTTWMGPTYLFEPTTADIGTVTRDLEGGGHPAILPGFGLCVPEYAQDWVTCFPFGSGTGLGGTQQPLVFTGIETPVAVAVGPSGDLIVVTGPEGISVVDRDSGERVALVGGFDNPSGILVLGETGSDFVTVAVDDTTTTAAPEPPPAQETPTTIQEAPSATPAPQVGDTGPPLWVGFLVALGAAGLFALLFLMGVRPWAAGAFGVIPVFLLPAFGYGWWMALLLLLLAVFAGAAVVGTGRALAGAPKPPVGPPGAGIAEPSAGGSIDMVPDDPCDELRRRAREAREQADAANAEANRLISEANAADDAARSATDALTAAERELADASKQPDPGSWIEDDDGRITQQDLELQRSASRAALGAYLAGDITAGELEATWEELGERDALEELREQDRQRREQRRAEAERAAADARDAHGAAQSAAEAARAAAEAAESAAAQAAVRAQQLEDALAECEKRTAEEYARQERERREAAAEREQELEEHEAWLASQPEVELEERIVPTPSIRDDDTSVCCPEGLWVGYGGSVSGHSLIAGIETTHLTMVCASHASRWVTMVCKTLRAGPGLGGQAGAVAAVAFAVHAAELPGIMQNALNGVDFDASVGVSLKNGLKNFAQPQALTDALTGLKRLADAKVPPAALGVGGTNAIKAAGTAVRAATKPPGKAAAKGAQSGGTGIVMPIGAIGAAAQFGVWLGVSTKVWVTGYQSCGCSPPGYSRG